MMALNNGVEIHPIPISTSVFLLTVLAPLMSPKPVTPPTTAWEVDTGTPTCVKKCTVMAADNAEIKAENPSSSTILLPTVFMTFLLYVNTPNAIERLPKTEA